jgi:RNA polymerase sporulation-specific sigma factor
MSHKVVICGVDTSTLPRLSEAESLDLLSRIKAGEERAKELFIVGNMRLVLSVIKRFWSKCKSLDDLFQAGCIGLIKSVDNFDLSVGVKFSTYAVPMIIGEIKRFMRDGNSLRVPRSIRDTAYQVLKTRGEIEKRDEEATLERIAGEMNVAIKEVVYALDAISDTVSLFDPVYNKSGDELLLVDQIGDEKNTDEQPLPNGQDLVI